MNNRGLRDRRRASVGVIYVYVYVWDRFTACRCKLGMRRAGLVWVDSNHKVKSNVFMRKRPRVTADEVEIEGERRGIVCKALLLKTKGDVLWYSAVVFYLLHAEEETRIGATQRIEEWVHRDEGCQEGYGGGWGEEERQWVPSIRNEIHKMRVA